jgi:hypothetical protein
MLYDEVVQACNLGIGKLSARKQGLCPPQHSVCCFESTDYRTKENSCTSLRRLPSRTEGRGSHVNNSKREARFGSIVAQCDEQTTTTSPKLFILIVPQIGRRPLVIRLFVVDYDATDHHVGVASSHQGPVALLIAATFPNFSPQHNKVLEQGERLKLI